MIKYLSNKYIKINCLNTLNKVLNDRIPSEKQQNKLIIHTANGVYIGTLKDLVDSENYEVKDDDDILTVYC